MKTSDITSEQMEAAIRELAADDGVEQLLAIPGVWECVAEEYNNAAIAKIQAEADEDEEDE